MRESLDRQAHEFFKLFAQYEFALKMMGYCQAGRNDQAEPQWDRFACEIAHPVMDLATPEVAEAREYLLTTPPKRQVWRGDHVAWELVNNEDRSVQMLFAHIRRVRNNLFHGGKFHDRWIDPDRSEALISRSLLLLRALANENGDLREALKGNHAGVSLPLPPASQIA